MASTENIRQWYAFGNRDKSSIIEPESASSVAEEAFQAAVKQCTQDSKQGKDARRILQNAASLEDIQEAVGKSMHEYEARGKNPKTVKWLHRAAKSIIHYSNVFDVFVPRNPEYVSLAWGAMKFLFTVCSNLSVINFTKFMESI